MRGQQSVLPQVRLQKPVLKPVTFDDFSGGWNALRTDLNMQRKYSDVMDNVYYAIDGTAAVRYGTKLFAVPSSVTSAPAGIINLTYFRTALVCVMSNGEIVAVQGDGTTTLIWSTAIAAKLPNNPAGWHSTTYASFAQFNSNLIIANGIDKPLIITPGYYVSYLQDLGSSTNINTPIAKYVSVAGRYVVFAGDPVKPNRVHISARDTSGTFYGDPAPNDATFIDIGSILANASTIRGLINFRNKLVVAYPEGCILGTLGIYNAGGTAHTPDFSDAVEQYGSIAHRTLLTFGEDCLFMDNIGVPSLKHNVFTGTMIPQRNSDLVDPAITAALSGLSQITFDEGTWGVFNQREGTFMYFVPNNSTPALVTETQCFVYTYRPQQNVSSWARFRNWNFTCGCRSIEGNIFFGDMHGKLWLYGSLQVPLFSDFIGDTSINAGAGSPINFTWDLPWSDFGRRANTKTTKYFGLDTVGSSDFTVSMYLDRILVDGNNADSPALTMNMTGGDDQGFGSTDQEFGGGRMTDDERLYAWPARFKLAKLRFTGSSVASLRFVRMVFYLQKGLFAA